jgi:serine/threonine protein kinase
MADHPGDDNTQSYVPLSKGTMVSHYRIVEKIGAGGMGEVYLALDTTLNRQVALKFLPPHLCQDEDCRRRFSREARAVAALNHPNIVTIHEVGELQGRPFFAMEHVEGRSLRDFAGDKELSIERILELGIQICEALNDAHEKGITHRDIKPSNILIDLHGRAKIVDFGLASVLGSDQLTQAGSTLGTIGYMSPEQVQGKEVDHRSDLFSLGVVLYELITRRNPFKRDTEAATLKAVSDEAPHPVARYRSDVPEGLQTIIDKALDKDVKTRYQHADGMLSDLIRLKRSLDSGRSMVFAPSHAVRPSRRYWVGAALVIVAAAIVFFVTKPWVSDEKSQEPDKIMLAVLPFENLGDPEDEYFADGMTDEITSRLGGLSALGVISRGSAVQYKSTTKGTRQIAEELKVDFILAGTLRWNKRGGLNRVLVTPQLIDAAQDVQVWSDRFESELSDVFSIQASIANEVVKSLEISLLQSEREQVQARPTADMVAYDYYLKSKKTNPLNAGELDGAIVLLNSAIERDSTFALAFAWLSYCTSQKYWYFGFTKHPDVDRARVHAEKAIELDSTLAMGYIALGHYYYWVEYDLDMALVMLQHATSLAPNNDQVLRSLSYIMRRTGNWQAAYQFQKRALELSPRIYDGAYPEILYTMRKYRVGLAYVDKMMPVQQTAYDSFCLAVNKALVLGRQAEDVRECKRNLPSDFERNFFGDQLDYRIYSNCAYWMRDYTEAMQLARLFLKCAQITYDSSIAYLDLAKICEKTNSDMQTVYADSAKSLLDPLIHEDLGLHSLWAIQVAMARAYALGGQMSEALNLVDSVLMTKPMTQDAWQGVNVVRNCLPILIAASDFETTLDLMDQILAVPSNLSIMELKSNPDFDPLRDHPRFQALIAKQENEHGT